MSNEPGIFAAIFILAAIYYGSEWLRKSGWGEVLGGALVLFSIILFAVQSIEMLGRLL